MINHCIIGKFALKIILSMSAPSRHVKMKWGYSTHDKTFISS